MRAYPERDGGRPRQCRPDGDRAQDRRRQEPADAGRGAARCAAALGLGLKIDNADVGRAGFVRCLPNGCIAEVVMDDELIKKLRAGKTATFIIFQTPEEGIGFPMSMAGFGEGYDKLP